MSDAVTFAGEGGSVVVSFDFGSAPESGESFVATAELASREFRARSEVRLTLWELRAFLDELRALSVSLTGVAEFISCDDTLYFKYQFDRGSGPMTGVIQWPFEQPELRTEFSFRSDQTFLTNALAELEPILSRLETRSL